MEVIASTAFAVVELHNVLVAVLGALTKQLAGQPADAHAQLSKAIAMVEGQCGLRVSQMLDALGKLASAANAQSE
jgi:hypothetical protein